MMAKTLGSERDLQSSYLGLPLASYLAVRSHNTTLGLGYLMCQREIMTLIKIVSLSWNCDYDSRKCQVSSSKIEKCLLMLTPTPASTATTPASNFQLLSRNYCHGIAVGYLDSSLSHLLSPIVVILTILLARSLS